MGHSQWPSPINTASGGQGIHRVPLKSSLWINKIKKNSFGLYGLPDEWLKPA